MAGNLKMALDELGAGDLGAAGALMAAKDAARLALGPSSFGLKAMLDDMAVRPVVSDSLKAMLDDMAVRPVVSDSLKAMVQRIGPTPVVAAGIVAVYADAVNLAQEPTITKLALRREMTEASARNFVAELTREASAASVENSSASVSMDRPESGLTSAQSAQLVALVLLLLLFLMVRISAPPASGAISDVTGPVADVITIAMQFAILRLIKNNR